MGFFAEFNTWLNGILAGYIGDKTAAIAAALEPAIVTLGIVYVMVWGYLQLMGKIDEPFMTGLRRIMLLVIVLGGALQLWLYNAVIVDTFYNAPAQLAAAVAGAASPVSTLDIVWQAGGNVANQLWSRAGLFGGDIGFYIAGLLVWIIYLVTGWAAVAWTAVGLLLPVAGLVNRRQAGMLFGREVLDVLFGHEHPRCDRLARFVEVLVEGGNLARRGSVRADQCRRHDSEREGPESHH